MESVPALLPACIEILAVSAMQGSYRLEPRGIAPGREDFLNRFRVYDLCRQRLLQPEDDLPAVRATTFGLTGEGILYLEKKWAGEHRNG